MRRLVPSALPSALIIAAIALVGAPAVAKGKALANARRARPPRSLAVFPPDVREWPCTKYAALTATEAVAELRKRDIAFREADAARGVLAPVRLTGPLNGVSWHTEVPRSLRGDSPWEVFDARLVLALHDFGTILGAHGIDEAVTFSAWRPPSKAWPTGKLADRHPGGVAVDVKKFHKKDGDVWLSVLDDFHGKIGAATCGEKANAPEPATAEAKALREIACTAGDQRLFHSILTPNYNAPHRNHFHLEVRQGVAWQLIR